jgi:aryl-alcohol dehydrogenase-like predicted oxidoreductase
MEQGEAMEKRRLGKTHLEVSVIGLGLWAIGGKDWGATDDRDSLGTIDAALDAGINFFDTADVYGDGHSELLLGEAMQGRRERFIVATKIGWIGFDEQRRCSGYTSPQQIIAGVEESLRRLRTDHVEVIQRHIDFPDPTAEVFLEGFQALQRAGKVRAYGLSTSDFAFLQQFNADGGCGTLQIDYSLLNRTPEAKILPYCQAQDIGVIVRGPLAMGILTGKFSAGTRFGENDFRRRWSESEEERKVFLEDLANVERLRPLATGRTLAQLALQFSIDHPAVTTSIPGAKTVAQLGENVAATGLPQLNAEARAEIGRIIPPGQGRKIWPA